MQEFSLKELGNDILKMEAMGGNRIWGLSSDAKLFQLWELHDSAAPPEDKPFLYRKKPASSPPQGPPASAKPLVVSPSPQASPQPSPPTSPNASPRSKSSARSLLTRSGQSLLSRTRSPSGTPQSAPPTPRHTPPASPHEPGPGSVIAGWTRATVNN